MPDPVDLDHLRTLLGGNIELENQIFEVFINSAQDSISSLESFCKDAKDSEWNEAAHTLKGSSGNVGANGMYCLCVKAQEAKNSPIEDKQAILQEIESEYQKIKVFLEQYLKK